MAFITKYPHSHPYQKPDTMLKGTKQLPAQSFFYADGMHLTKATNGYGGSVEFDYDDNPNQTLYQPWYYKSVQYESYIGNQGYGANMYCKNAGYAGGWTAIPTGTGNANCLDDSYFWNLQVSGTIYNPAIPTPFTVYNNPDGVSPDFRIPVHARPGNAYKVDVTVVSGSVTAGIYEGVNPVYGNSNVAILALPPLTASVAYPVINSPGSAVISGFKIQFLPTYYLVKRKTVSDGNNHSYNYTYNYSGTAVNDAAHSLMVSGGCPPGHGNPPCLSYIPEDYEFRGHAAVTETRPDGTKTVTSYHQDDAFKGRPNQCSGS